MGNKRHESLLSRRGFLQIAGAFSAIGSFSFLLSKKASAMMPFAIHSQGSSTGVPVVPDSNFKNTVLLLSGDGASGTQNNTFIDSSNNAFTVTRNGNTTQGSFSPFSPTGWSAYFDGSSYFTIANNANIQPGTGDWTIEFWIYVPALSGVLEFYTKGNGVQIFTSGSTIYCCLSSNNTTSYYINASFGTAAINTWSHVAVVRSGNTYTGYLNGVPTILGTSASSPDTGTDLLSIGALYNGSYKITGYISNVRFVKGTAIYTSNFSAGLPTVALTAVANTQLLCLQNNLFGDNSSNVFVLTVAAGTPKIQVFSPFAPSVSYSTTTHGGSAYFDGTGDYLSVADTTKFDFGSSNFTIEGWLNPTTSAQLAVVARGLSSGFIGFIVSTTNFLASTNGSSWDITITFSSALIANAYNHLAVVRNGNVYTAYLNGVAVGTTTVAGAIQAGTGNALVIGSRSGQTDYSGYMSDLRIIKGTAVYTGNFTSPTAPLTVITNTQLLLSCTNAGIYDAHASNDIETVGNVQISTAVKNFGTGSMSFDGTGDYLSIPNSVNFQFGTGDFTIEGWFYSTSIATTQTIVSYSNPSVSAGADDGIRIYLSGSKVVACFYSGSAQYELQGTTTLSSTTWYYVKYYRISGTTYLYLGNNQEATASHALTINAPTSATLKFGTYCTGTTQYFVGYLDDWRITKGVGRTGGTTPTEAFAGL